MIKFAPNLTPDDRNVVAQSTINLLNEIAKKSNNPEITISSTLRTPARQANAMYDNEKKGNSIRYAAPGREVIAVYNVNKSKPKEEVVKLMTAKIEDLARKGQLVSRHCVTKDQYAKNNIIDISKNIPNPRDFVLEAEKHGAVKKIITPIAAFSAHPYNKSKVSVDAAEPAIHLEIVVI
jgi:hypothetical protein